jgi:hypothetical protein
VDFACHPSSKSFYPMSLYLFLRDLQLYLFVILSSYGSAQRRDHDDRIYDPLTAENIPLDISTDRTDPWDSRPSVDHQYGTQDPKHHVRNPSTISASDLNNQKPVNSLLDYNPSHGNTDKAKPHKHKVSLDFTDSGQNPGFNVNF